MRGDLAHVDDRALAVVNASYERRSGRIIGRSSSRWVRFNNLVVKSADRQNALDGRSADNYI